MSILACCAGSRLLLGPWGHGGNMYCRLAERAATRSAFSASLQCIDFFDRVCGYHPSGRYGLVLAIIKESIGGYNG